MTHRTQMMTIVINHDASYTNDDNRHNHDRIVHALTMDDAAEILFRTNEQGDSRSRIEGQKVL